jgi:hypothetical protein
MPVQEVLFGAFYPFRFIGKVRIVVQIKIGEGVPVDKFFSVNIQKQSTKAPAP